MVWLAIAIGAAAILLVAAVRPGRWRLDDVDPLLPVGLALASAGAVLVTTLGAVMYGVMAMGLIVMAVGAIRARWRKH